MTDKQAIATPLGLFMAGYSGAGGDYIPMKAIYRDIYQHLPNGILFGLKIENGANAPTKDSMIIDIAFTAPDGSMSTIHDPHIVEQVTDYPVEQAARGIVWFGTAKPPGYTPFSAYGIHSVIIKVAPRTAPVTSTHLESKTAADGTVTTSVVPDSVSQILPARDFSPAAGGRIAEFAFEIKKGPIPAPQFNDD